MNERSFINKYLNKTVENKQFHYIATCSLLYMTVRFFYEQEYGMNLICTSQGRWFKSFVVHCSK